ncbi:MAG: dethiobiotin synthase [Acidimicrobiales bacterium]
MSSRPERLAFIAGTATEVGKTWTAAAIAAGLRARGTSVSARKPVQSFAAGSGATDAEVLAAATGEQPQDVCPRHRWYGVALAPPMAAVALGRPGFALADLMADLAWPAGTAVGLVEGVGGPASPLADDTDSAALARALSPDLVVLVAPAGLGAINAVRLAVAALPPPVVVFLNHFDPADPTQVANAAWLTTRDGFTVVTSVDALLTDVSRK